MLDPATRSTSTSRTRSSPGRGLSHNDVVEMVVRDGPDRIRDLIALGASVHAAPTRTATGGARPHREGGHSARRIVHAGDITGREVERALLEAVANATSACSTSTWRSTSSRSQASAGRARRGRLRARRRHRQVVHTCRARATVLATGGAGKVYLYTTNPDVATGDGVAMAYRAGAEVANMEFFQFHPTCLYPPAGQELPDHRGAARRGRHPAAARRHRVHGAASPRADLAPRDIVARAIDYEMKRTGAEHVLLDITDKPASFVRERFPNIYAECLRFGIDITAQPIPVVPAAHYMCGGVVVKTDADGRTTITGLCAIGECAFTGLHGANRLASNSLLEGHGLRRARRRSRARSSEREARRPTCPTGTSAKPCRATRRSSSRTTGTSSAASCGTTSASCAPTSASRARAPHRAAQGRDPRVLLEAPGHARSARAAQHRRRRRAHRRVRAARHESRGLHWWRC